MDSSEEENCPRSLSAPGLWKKTCTISKSLIEEWVIIISVIFRFLVVVPLGLSIFAMYYASSPKADQSYSVFLNIVATILSGLAGAFIFDSINKVMGNTIIQKKGASAVRNLSQTRQNIKNIIDRIKADASTDEVQNLLSRLEKDVANATQEWNDILPGVAKIEEVYSLLHEKERELELENKRNKEMAKEVSAQQTKEGEKEQLLKELQKSKARIESLTMEISRLQSSTSVVASTAATAGTTGVTFGFGAPGYMGFAVGPRRGLTVGRCTSCGDLYNPGGLMDQGKCPKCLALGK